MRTFVRHMAVAALVAANTLAPGMAFAESTGVGAAAPKPNDDFCSSFVDAAAEVRAANQKKQLDTIRADIEQKLAELTEKTQTLQTLIAERDAARAKVSESLLKIYSTVESEAAAQQMAKLDPNTAAELLIRLAPKKSGEILSIMEPAKAARLVALMSLRGQDKGDVKS
ncbi:MAG: hypothetical protein LCH46_06845 [Proteobacteria bacterium]|nr:hypothetical protein [Pseudomonadota bacterium]